MDIKNSPAPTDFNAGSGVLLKTVYYDIGVWDMVTNASVDVAISEDFTKIVGIQTLITNDTNTAIRSLDTINGENSKLGGETRIVSGKVTLYRVTGGMFDHVAFDSGVINRGTIVITLKV